MFPFTYKFKREIKTTKTSKNVVDCIRDSLKKRKIQNILYTDNTVSFNEGFIKERSNTDYLSLIDMGEFIYEEESKILIYKVKLWKLNIFALLIGVFTIIYFDSFFGKSLPFIGLIINHMFSYFGSQSLINEISHKLNYL